MCRCSKKAPYQECHTRQNKMDFLTKGWDIKKPIVTYSLAIKVAYMRKRPDSAWTWTLQGSKEEVMGSWGWLRALCPWLERQRHSGSRCCPKRHCWPVSSISCVLGRDTLAAGDARTNNPKQTSLANHSKTYTSQRFTRRAKGSNYRGPHTQKVL